MKAIASYQKLRGGYYTPPSVAKFLTFWAIRSASDCILEPSCGDGVFLQVAAQRLSEMGAKDKGLGGQIFGCEVDQFEAVKAAEQLRTKGVRERQINVHCGDFFAHYDEFRRQKFAAVVGNPPFIRYQNFPDVQRERAVAVMRSAGLNPNRLTNAWVPFVVASVQLLSSVGRLAMVVPAELLQVTYAAELRRFLSDAFSRITVVTFRKLAFEGIQQEVVLLLCERLQDTNAAAQIELLELEDIEELRHYNPEHFPLNGFKTLDHSKEKWTQYYLSQREINLLRFLRHDAGLPTLGDYAGTDIGIVTGMNDVFVVSDTVVKEKRLRRYVIPIVSRSNQLDGLLFRKSDWSKNVESGQRSFLLKLPPRPMSEFPAPIQSYLLAAEEAGYHKGYKCRIRKFWYVVPSIYAPDGFLLRQIHSFPKLILNEAGATSTDTIHRVRFKQKVNRRRFAAAFLNSLSFAFSEVLGRSYGGGVLELEPNEADSIPLALSGVEALDPVGLDKLLRTQGIEAVLPITNRLLFGETLRLTSSQVNDLTSIWVKLRDRRVGRKLAKVELAASA